MKTPYDAEIAELGTVLARHQTRATYWKWVLQIEDLEARVEGYLAAMNSPQVQGLVAVAKEMMSVLEIIDFSNEAAGEKGGDK